MALSKYSITTCWKNYSFLIKLSWHLFQICWTYVCGSIYVFSTLFFIFYIFFFMPIWHCLNYCSFIISLKSGLVEVLWFCSLGYSRIFIFSSNLYSQLDIFLTKKPARFWSELQWIFGEFNITILNLQLHVHSTFFSSSSISLINFWKSFNVYFIQLFKFILNI